MLNPLINSDGHKVTQKYPLFIYIYIFSESGIPKNSGIFAGQNMFLGQKKDVLNTRKLYFSRSRLQFDKNQSGLYS